MGSCPEIPERPSNDRTEIPLRQGRREKERMATNIAVATTGGASADSAHLLLEDRVWLLRALLLMRGLAARAMTLYRQGRVPGSFDEGCGQEPGSGGAVFAMERAGGLRV